MFDGKIDGNFILVKGQSIAQAAIEELGIDNNSPQYESIFTQINEICQNKSNYQISGQNNDIIAFTKECWSKIIEFINEKIPTLKIKSQSTNNFDKIGKECISYWNNNFSNVESSTKLEMDSIIARRQGNEELADILYSQAEEIDKRYNEEMDNLHGDKFTQWIKEHKYANCADRSIIIKDYLDKQGIKNNVIEIHSNVRNNKFPQCVDHQFNIIGLDEKADISDPSTWGDNAVIIDAWSGNSYPAKEGLKLYQNLWDFTNEDITNKTVIIENHGS